MNHQRLPSCLFSSIKDDKEDKEDFSKLIISIVEDKYCYDHNCFNPSLAKLISHKDFDSILTQCDLFLSYSRIKKRKHDTLKIPTWVYFLFLISFILIILFLFLLYYASRKKNGKKLYSAGVVFCIVACVLVIVILIYNMNKEITRFKTFQEFFYEDAKPFLDKKNAEFGQNIFFTINKNNLTLEVTYKTQGQMCLTSRRETEREIDDFDTHLILSPRKNENNKICFIFDNNNQQGSLFKKEKKD